MEYVHRNNPSPFKTPGVMLFVIFATMFLAGCKKEAAPPDPASFTVAYTVNGANNGTNSYTNLNLKPVVEFSFAAPVAPNSMASAINWLSSTGSSIAIQTQLSADAKKITVQPTSNLAGFTNYQLNVSRSLQSTSGLSLWNPLTVSLKTALDSSDKFNQLSDDALLTLVQQQTFKYFWIFGHPVSGLARERNTSGETVTTGGSGFGIMAIIAAIHRNFISRAQGLARMQTIVDFLKNKGAKFHGAFPHWLNGTTGAVQPFSTKDDGADLVETSFLIEGLLCARQYFNGADAAETALRNDINAIWQGVEWNWFRQNNQNVLYWHWSPNFNWEINLPIKGWNECLVTYVLAASSPTNSIPKIVYDAGWANNGAMKNGNTYYGYQLPLGPPYGGPLFLEHYSFMGINPKNLTDQYANYELQTRNHTLINYEYCKANPKGYDGYSEACWGLTASDIPGGYAASSPTSDRGVIAPTAALSSFPYTPTESLKGLKFFYYKLGDKLWGEYGFYDAFSLQDQWFASSYLAIDQGPIMVMIENYRSGLLWNLFMSCPEIKTGMKSLGFQSPHL